MRNLIAQTIKATSKPWTSPNPPTPPQSSKRFSSSHLSRVRSLCSYPPVPIMPLPGRRYTANARFPASSGDGGATPARMIADNGGGACVKLIWFGMGSPRVLRLVLRSMTFSGREFAPCRVWASVPILYRMLALYCWWVKHGGLRMVKCPRLWSVVLCVKCVYLVIRKWSVCWISP